MKIALRVLATLNLLLASGTLVLAFQLQPGGCSGECFISFPEGFEQFAVSFLLTALGMVVLAITAAVASGRAGRKGWAVGFVVGASSPLLAVAMVFSGYGLIAAFIPLCLAAIGVPVAALLFTWLPASRRAEIPALTGPPTSGRQVP